MRSDDAAAWPFVRLDQLAGNHDRRRVPLSSAQRAARCGPYPYWGANGILDHVDSYLFDGPHILLAEDGTVERADGRAVVHSPSGRFWVNNHAHVLVATTGTAQSWLYYALSEVRVHPYLTGSVQPKLTQRSMNSIELQQPPLAEQHRVAAVLGVLDAKIDSNRRLAAVLEQTAATEFRARFIDFVGENHFVETDSGRVPQGWTVAPVGETLTVVGGGTPSTKEPRYWEGGTHCWATPKDLSGAKSPVLLDTARYLTTEGVSRISSRLLPARTVLLSSRAPVGYTSMSLVEVAVNQGFIAIPPSDSVPSEYVLLWLRENMDLIKAHAGGTTFAEISKRAFRPLPMALPPLAARLEFEALSRPVFDLIAGHEREIRNLSSIRDALLPKLISGEIRVPDTADPGEVIGPAVEGAAAAA